MQQETGLISSNEAIIEDNGRLSGLAVVNLYRFLKANWYLTKGMATPFINLSNEFSHTKKLPFATNLPNNEFTFPGIPLYLPNTSLAEIDICGYDQINTFVKYM